MRFDSILLICLRVNNNNEQLIKRCTHKKQIQKAIWIERTKKFWQNRNYIACHVQNRKSFLIEYSMKKKFHRSLDRHRQKNVTLKNIVKHFVSFIRIECSIICYNYIFLFFSRLDCRECEFFVCWKYVA